MVTYPSKKKQDVVIGLDCKRQSGKGEYSAGCSRYRQHIQRQNNTKSYNSNNLILSLREKLQVRVKHPKCQQHLMIQKKYELSSLFLFCYQCYITSPMFARNLTEIEMIFLIKIILLRKLLKQTPHCCCLVAKSCPTLLRSHGLQPTRLLCP